MAVSQPPQSSQQPDLDTQVLSDFIYELNISRRHLATFFSTLGWLYRHYFRVQVEGIGEAEIEVLEAYLPAKMDDAELEALIDEVISATGAESIRDMGKVMGAVKAAITGRADMAVVSAKVKARLAA